MVLIFNFGSSSLKFKIFNEKDDSLFLEGKCCNFGENRGIINVKLKEKNINKGFVYKNQNDIFSNIKELIFENDFLIKLKQIKLIAHRVVHGGVYFKSMVFIKKDVIDKIQKLIPLAPIHNKINLEGILKCFELFGEKIKQIAVFDTSFFLDLPKKACTYAIPSRLSKKYNLRKYGFHGISHKYAYKKCLEYFKKDNIKVISCHLGNGSSIAAIVNGKPIDTTMGLTPLGGLIMNTRCGSLDPSVVIELMKYENLSFDDIYEVLNKKSGILGVSNFSSDMQEVIKNYENDESCKLAIDMFCYKIIKYIGAYFFAMKGCDAIVFTAGIGENSPFIREKICEGLSFLGIEFKYDSNNTNENLISSGKSKIKIINLTADEETCIYEEIKNFV